MEEKRVATEEEIQLAVSMNHLKTLSALLRNFDYEHDANQAEIKPLSESIHQIGNGLLDVDPDFYLEHDALEGLGDLMSRMNSINGEAIRGFSIFLDAIYRRVEQKKEILNLSDVDEDGTVFSKIPDLSDLDIEDKASDSFQTLV